MTFELQNWIFLSFDYSFLKVFLNNVMRIKSVIMEFVAIAKFVESCLEWESPVRSVTAFIAYLAIVYYFQVLDWKTLILSFCFNGSKKNIDFYLTPCFYQGKYCARFPIMACKWKRKVWENGWRARQSSYWFLALTLGVVVGHQVGQKVSQDLKTTRNFSQGHGENLMILLPRFLQSCYTD